ncbi:hypothetical protein [Desulfatirhabdium butyrativorans]|uniref:hypothetical protein n=1 Tax=Desulfatirhabdium butyrativorans TaxID=340467 RepID=UPI000422EA14|nr:hypothetical protein [Desulfatirhabdium butyrativorans]
MIIVINNQNPAHGAFPSCSWQKLPLPGMNIRRVISAKAKIQQCFKDLQLADFTQPFSRSVRVTSLNLINDDLRDETFKFVASIYPPLHRHLLMSSNYNITAWPLFAF